MYSFVVLFVLFATALGQDNHCRANVSDSYVMWSNIYGSLFHGNRTNEYYSFVGENQLAVRYVKDNQNMTAMYSNTTLVVRKGVSGEFQFSGWLYSLYQGGIEYRIQYANGIRGQCSPFPNRPVMQASNIISNLYTIFPTPELHPIHGAPSICQGLIEKTDTIVNVGWLLGPVDMIRFISALSEEASVYGNTIEYRKFNENTDNHYFINPCKGDGSEKVGQDSQLIGRLYRALRHLS